MVGPISGSYRRGRGMHRILAKRHLDRLAEFATANVLLAFDFDGTLAPIADRPSGARMRASTRQLLVAVSRLYPVIVISGRARADLARRVGRVPVWHLTGNHGLEPWGMHHDYPPLVRGWVRELRREMADEPGVLVEDKQYSLTVHYRAVPTARKRAVVARARRVARVLGGVRLVGGKDALSFVPLEAPHKGVALERARRLLACECAIYVGDDDTDEDAFSAASPDRLLAIRVGRSQRSAAPYYLTTQSEVDDLLGTLIRLRRPEARIDLLAPGRP